MKKTFTCDRCNRDFNRKYNLNQHLKRKNPCVKKEENKITHFQMNTNEHKMNTNEYKRTQMNTNEHKILNQCLHCKKGFVNNSSLKRHIKLYCKIKKEEEEVLKLDIINAKIKLLELQVKVASSNTNCHNTNNNTTTTTNSNSNNTVNNNTVNITVNDYGKENINYLESDKYKTLINKILGNGMLGLQQYIKFKYCNPEAPENLTIKYTNQRSNKLKVRKDNSWKTRDKNEVMDELYDRDNNVEEVLGVYEHINDLQEVEEMDDNQEEFVTKIGTFYESDEEEDGEMKKLKDITLNNFYDCFKNNKEKFDPYSNPN